MNIILPTIVNILPFSWNSQAKNHLFTNFFKKGNFYYARLDIRHFYKSVALNYGNYIFFNDHYKTWSYFLHVNFAHHILWSNANLLPNFSLNSTTPLFTISGKSHQGFSWLIHNLTLWKSIFLYIQYIVAQVFCLCNIWIFSYKKFFMKRAHSGTFRACNLIRKMLHFQC